MELSGVPGHKLANFQPVSTTYLKLKLKKIRVFGYCTFLLLKSDFALKSAQTHLKLLCGISLHSKDGFHSILDRIGQDKNFEFLNILYSYPSFSPILSQHVCCLDWKLNIVRSGTCHDISCLNLNLEECQGYFLIENSISDENLPFGCFGSYATGSGSFNTYKSGVPIELNKELGLCKCSTGMCKTNYQILIFFETKRLRLHFLVNFIKLFLCNPLIFSRKSKIFSIRIKYQLKF